MNFHTFTQDLAILIVPHSLSKKKKRNFSKFLLLCFMNGFGTEFSCLGELSIKKEQQYL